MDCLIRGERRGTKPLSFYNLLLIVIAIVWPRAFLARLAFCLSRLS